MLCIFLLFPGSPCWAMFCSWAGFPSCLANFRFCAEKKGRTLHICIYIYISESGGSEIAFRQASRNREIVLCRASVRARGVVGRWKCASKAPPSTFPFGRGSLFPCGVTMGPSEFKWYQVNHMKSNEPK